MTTTTHTADDFRNARFATHPDGRTAARVAPWTDIPWICSAPKPEWDFDWYDDADMARDGWSPLDETRLPRIVTDEMVERAQDAWLRAIREGHPQPWHLSIAAALSVAPTTDEDAGIGPETRAAYRELHDPTTDEDPKIEGLRLALRKAQERIEEVERDREQAEQERDEAREARDRNAARLWETQTKLVKAEVKAAAAPRDRATMHVSMTARDHLAAAWAAAHVPADGTIPAGAEYVLRHIDGAIFGPCTPNVELLGSEEDGERRLVDPPTTARPEGAEAIEDVLLADDVPGLAGAPAWLPELADFLAERGVRAPEEER